MSFPKIILKPGKEHSLKRFHPWVFSGAIARVEGTAHDGDIVEVCDNNGTYLATGHCADGSITVRVFSFEGYDGSDAFWQAKLQNANPLPWADLHFFKL
jgi:23S rRNA (cytosine1962-C5)-methyltransferase